MAITAKTYPTILKYGTQASYNALETKDASVLYFCTDTKKIYKGSIDFTESVRCVSTKPADPAVGIAYVMADTGAVEVYDGSSWKVISYPTVTSISASSTDTQVASAKAIYDFVEQDIEDHLGVIPTTSEATTIVGYVDEQVAKATGDASKVAQDLADEIERATAAEEAAQAQADLAIEKIGDTDSGLVKDIADVNTRIDNLGTASAADVSTTEIAAETAVAASLPTVAQVKKYVTDSVKDLEGAMHFVGVITRNEGETDAQAIARVVTSPVAGDVVVMSDNAKEYIYNGTAWQEVGDEGLYVTKATTIAGVDLEDSITKDELLTALNVEDGAQVNIIETVKVNGTALAVTDKAVNVTVVTGTEDGTVAVNGVDVAVKGLGTAAFTDADAYDAAGDAAQAASDLKDELLPLIEQNEADIASLAAATTVWGTF